MYIILIRRNYIECFWELFTEKYFTTKEKAEKYIEKYQDEVFDIIELMKEED